MGIYATFTSWPVVMSRYYEGDNEHGDVKGEELVAKHISRAEGLVNSYLACRYSLPFTTVPPDVIRLTEDITSWFLIRAGQWQVGTINPYVADYKGAIDDLKEIRAGTLCLTNTNGSVIATSTDTIKSSTADYTPIFEIDDSINWNPDDDKVTDLESSRQ